MDIFISWSKERSRGVAEALKKWIPHFVQSAKPWLSASDIAAGERWSLSVAGQLEKSQIGIFCLTPENLYTPWMLFEAGAISKKVNGAIVCPYLFEVSEAEIPDPYRQFQVTTTEKDATRNLIKAINSQLGENAVDDEVLENTFKRFWPELKKAFEKIPPLEVESSTIREATLRRSSLETFREIARGGGEYVVKRKRD